MSRVFSGVTGNYLLCSGTTFISTPSVITFLMWVKLNATTSGQLGGYANTSTNNALLSVLGDATLRFQTNQEFGGANAVGTQTVPTDEWFPVIGVRQSNNTTDLYALGESIGGGFGGAFVSPESSPRIGVGTHPYNFGFAPIDGKIAHVALWSSELSSGDISSLIAGADPSTISSETLVEYWALTGSSLVGTNGRTLAVTGTVNNDDADNPTVGGSPSATVTPTTGSLVVDGRAALVNDFDAITLRGTLINEAGSPLADLTGLSCLVWYNTAPAGAPDESLSSLTTNSNGSYSFALALGGLAFGERIYRVIYREDPPTANNCRVHSPDYE